MWKQINVSVKIITEQLVLLSPAVSLCNTVHWIYSAAVDCGQTSLENL